MFSKRRRGKRLPPAREFAVHAMIADTLRLSIMPAWVWWHTPNGGARTKAEAGMLFRMGTKAGVSDFLLLGPPAGRLHALELKRAGIRPTEQQIAFLEAVRRAGGRADWTDNYDDAIRILADWGAVRVRL
jgi:hypothetical protein